MPTLIEFFQNLVVYLEESPVGLTDGENTHFVLNQTPVGNSAQIFVDGVHQIPDVDYTIDVRNIDFFTAPFVDSVVTSTYITSSFVDVASQFEWNENLGSGDGSTVEFFVANGPVANSTIDVFVNGVRQSLHNDFELSDAQDSVIFFNAPFNGSTIYANYRHAFDGEVDGFLPFVFGPDGATDESIVVFNGTGGTSIKESPILSNASGLIPTVADTLIIGSDDSHFAESHINNVFADNISTNNVNTGDLTAYSINTNYFTGISILGTNIGAQTVNGSIAVVGDKVTAFSSSFAPTVGSNMTTGTTAVFSNITGTNISSQNLTVTDSVTLPTGITIEPATQHYVFSNDTTTQGISNANTFQNISFNRNVLINGWTHTTGSDFVCNRAGIYAVDYAIVPQNTSALTVANFEGRGTINNVEVSGSQIGQTIPVLSVASPFANNFLINISSGQTFRLQMAATTTQIQILPVGNNAVISNSATLRIMRII